MFIYEENDFEPVRFHSGWSNKGVVHSKMLNSVII